MGSVEPAVEDVRGQQERQQRREGVHPAAAVILLHRHVGGGSGGGGGGRHRYRRSSGAGLSIGHLMETECVESQRSILNKESSIDFKNSIFN